MNLLLRILLIESGKFHEDDVRSHWTLLWGISPHQFMRVRMEDDRWIDIDLWAKRYGIAFGDHAHGFHYRS